VPAEEPVVAELFDRLSAIRAKYAAFAKVIDVESKDQQIFRLESRMAEADFWNDQVRAQAQVGELKAIKAVIDPWRELDTAARDAAELCEMAEAEADQGTLDGLQDEAKRLTEAYEKLELTLALSGKYDRCNVFLSIKPGAGGTESCDWGEMLFRMYSNFAQKKGWGFDVLDMLPGEIAGLKACTVRITGDNVYGYLKAEMGTHRLVRISPFDSNARRQTSFTAIEVTPEMDQVGEVKLDEKDLRIDTYRASGAGGQHVNKTDSAVRVTHVPTGLFVACQAERSQVQNKATAMSMLAAKLQQMRDSERLDELKDLKGERGTIAWGHQIRSYVMMPYQMVKDLRTGHSTSRIQDVLDGDVQEFLDAYLRWVIAGRPDRKAQAGDDE
jgi:peptide chain release factor 2